jgi:hypothetical protein
MRWLSSKPMRKGLEENENALVPAFPGNCPWSIPEQAIVAQEREPNPFVRATNEHEFARFRQDKDSFGS